MYSRSFPPSGYTIQVTCILSALRTADDAPYKSRLCNHTRAPTRVSADQALQRGLCKVGGALPTGH